MFGALRDSIPLLTRCKHLSDPKELIEIFSTEMNAVVEQV